MMIFNKRANATLFIAAAVAVLAVVGLVISGTANSGLQVFKGIQTSDYRNIGIRSDVDATGWNLGLELGERYYDSSKGDKKCGRECGNECSVIYSITDVNTCFQFCKSGCEKRQLELLMTGGYTTP